MSTRLGCCLKHSADDFRLWPRTKIDDDDARIPAGVNVWRIPACYRIAARAVQSAQQDGGLNPFRKKEKHHAEEYRSDPMGQPASAEAVIAFPCHGSSPG